MFCCCLLLVCVGSRLGKVFLHEEARNKPIEKIRNEAPPRTPSSGPVPDSPSLLASITRKSTHPITGCPILSREKGGKGKRIRG
ncbi:hypothetical protein B0T19DRAFT_25747 [Cercophora scortea]|uniref:Secreted protein n=1 Tax=Cercophora scortea TaxID=314031 RepID=A0AAE0MKJ7_9PEZI|nr:hypothetical protein B0T19DRAFT_25747 [Cercophora scortea]